MKYNNKSCFIKDWTTKKLKNDALMYDDMVHGQNACWNSKDVMMLEMICAELDKRGIEVNSKLTFN